MVSTDRPALSIHLRHETAEWHQRVERGPLMSELVAGHIEAWRYGLLLRNLHALYLALEAGLDDASRTLDLRALWSPALRRAPALGADLDHLHPGPWREHLPILNAMQRYVEHLQALASAEPLRLVAHAYLRYLGDLHGGQLLAERVRSRFGLQGVEGTRFYDFGTAPVAAALRRDFRAGLDALSLTPAEAAAMVAETLAAYERHEAVFDEISAARPPA